MFLTGQSSWIPSSETVTQVKGKFLCCGSHTKSIPRIQVETEAKETERSSMYHTETCQGLPGQAQVSGIGGICVT